MRFVIVQAVQGFCSRGFSGCPGMAVSCLGCARFYWALRVARADRRLPAASWGVVPFVKVNAQEQ